MKLSRLLRSEEARQTLDLTLRLTQRSVSSEFKGTALGRLCETGGGLVLAEGGSVRGSLPLPIGGLMTHLDAESVARALEDLERGAEQLGVQLPHPFMALSFLCLSVVPNLRITDQGYVDIVRGGLQPLFSKGD